MTSQNLARNPDAPKSCLTLQQAERFYYIWRRVLRYVNERKQVAAPFAITDAGLERMSGEQAVPKQMHETVRPVRPSSL